MKIGTLVKTTSGGIVFIGVVKGYSPRNPIIPVLWTSGQLARVHKHYLEVLCE